MMILRLSFSIVSALIYAACCAWVMARWLPLAPADSALLSALLLPVTSVLLFLWLWFARSRSRFALRLVVTGVVVIAGIALSPAPVSPDHSIAVLEHSDTTATTQIQAEVSHGS